MSKDLDTQGAANSLTDPRSSPTGEPQPIGDNDFTNATNDISKADRMTLGKFLSGKTEGKNSYPIVGPNEVTDPIRVQTRGKEAAFLPAYQSNQTHFTGDDLKTAQNLLQNGEAPPKNSTVQTLKSSGLGVQKSPGGVVKQNRLTSFFTDAQISDVLSKNAGDVDPATLKKSGHTLLSGIPSDGAGDAIVAVGHPASAAPTGNSNGEQLLRYIHQQLKDGNLFTPDPNNSARGPFSQKPGKNEEEATRGLFTIQRNLGYFDVDGERVSVSDMSAMALASMLRAADNQFFSDELMKSKELGGWVGLSPLAIVTRPGQFGSTGVKISDFRLSALNSRATGQGDFIIVLEDSPGLVTRGSPPNNEGLPNLQSTPRNAGSFSQMNTFLEPFAVGTRFSSIGMFTMALASMLLMLAVGLAVQFIGFLVGDHNKKEDAQFQLNPARTSKLAGFYKPKGEGIGAAILRFLRVTNTDYPFDECLRLGIRSLYGLPPDSSGTGFSEFATGDAWATIGESLFFSGGYYANFTRRILASATNVVGSFAKVASSSVIGGIEALFKGIEDLADSAVFKFIMIAAGLGDAEMKSALGPKFLGISDRYLLGSHEKQINPFEFQKFEIIKANKDRQVSGKAGKLGVYRNQVNRWTQANGASSLSLRTFLASDKGIKNLETPDKYNRKFTPDRDSVVMLEDALESEYMPFYIHDLRTHEVMSMPAFITEFGESFTANYNSVEGIGRQDPVRLYQKTERAVTFGFVLAAFSAEDHALMWHTINKLVAMCYPQYSVGRKRFTGKQRAEFAKEGKEYFADISNPNRDDIDFIQPFSQVAAASPMVRLRLGDVFKSNYSKFGLARLFGANTENFSTVWDAEYKKSLNAVIEKASALRDSYNKEFFDAVAKLQGGDYINQLNYFASLSTEAAKGTLNAKEQAEYDSAVKALFEAEGGEAAKQEGKAGLEAAVAAMNDPAKSAAAASAKLTIDKYKGKTIKNEASIVVKPSTPYLHLMNYPAGSKTASEKKLVVVPRLLENRRYEMKIYSLAWSAESLVSYVTKGLSGQLKKGDKFHIHDDYEAAKAKKLNSLMLIVVPLENGEPAVIGDANTSYFAISLESVEGLHPTLIKRKADADDTLKELLKKSSDLFKQSNGPSKLNVETDFFNADKNAIVRSFETSRGKGVAGFITSIGLDYGMGSHPWETANGSKAPMMVKISLGFLPITDLPLGLDANGEMRNPSHPVGPHAGSFGDVYDELGLSTAGGIVKPVFAEGTSQIIRGASGASEAERDIMARFSAKKSGG